MTEIMNITPNHAPTMSSREIAELVESRHDNVKRAIERLAERGVIDVPPMEEYPDTLGRKAAEYRIGKRDSYVIVAQLCPEFTARLVDRWQVLEAAVHSGPTFSGNSEKGRPSVHIAVAREARLQYRMFREMLKDLNIKGNQAVLAANRATVMTTGFDAMGALGITHAKAEVNEPDLRPSDIAERLGLRTAQEVNKLLLQHGYQSAHRDHKARLYYELTPKGERAGGVFKDTGKRSGNGVPVKQLMWAAGICDCLRSDMSLEAA